MSSDLISYEKDLEVDLLKSLVIEAADYLERMPLSFETLKLVKKLRNGIDVHKQVNPFSTINWSPSFELIKHTPAGVPYGLTFDGGDFSSLKITVHNKPSNKELDLIFSDKEQLDLLIAYLIGARNNLIFT